MNVDKMIAQHTPTPEQKRRMNSLRNLARNTCRGHTYSPSKLISSRVGTLP
jgi:hypothetical protein